MSVLNQTSDGLFTVLIVLVRTLIRIGAQPRESLINACGGSVEAVDASQLIKTLNRWTDLGLFSSHNESISIAEPHLSLLGKTADEAETRLPSVARAIVLSPHNNERFWESEDSKSADLSRGLSWLLAQDVYSLDTNASKSIALLEIEQLVDPSRCIFQNDTRWNGLRAWMPYLGFAREGAQMSVDPTAAVRDALQVVLNQTQPLPARAFVNSISEVLPVLDGGSYRTQVEAVLKPAVWRKPAEGQLSPAFSRALQCLEREGTVAFEQRSDTKEGITLMGAGGRSWREVTHIRAGDKFKRAR